MSTGGGIGSVTAAVAVAVTFTVVHNGDADDDTADDGVGGPDLEYMAGDMELCLLLLKLSLVPGMLVFVDNDVGILGSMRRKLHGRFVCWQLPHDGLSSSHCSLVRIMDGIRLGSFDIAAMDRCIFRRKRTVEKHTLTCRCLHCIHPLRDFLWNFRVSLLRCLSAIVFVDMKPIDDSVSYHMIAHRCESNRKLVLLVKI